MKKLLYWPYLFVGAIVLTVLVLLFFVGRVLEGIFEVGFNLLSRGEWWILDQHKEINQILSPFNQKLKDVFLGGFRD